MRNLLKKIFDREQTVPKYKYMEVETDYSNLQSDYIEGLQDRIEEQKRYIASLEKQLLDYQHKEEPTKVVSLPTRRKISNMTELASVMEELSIQRKRMKDEKKSAS